MTKHLAKISYYIHTPLGGVDVPFAGYSLWSTF